MGERERESAKLKKRGSQNSAIESFERRALLSLLSPLSHFPFLLLRRNVVFSHPPSFPSERRLDSFFFSSSRLSVSFAEREEKREEKKTFFSFFFPLHSRRVVFFDESEVRGKEKKKNHGCQAQQQNAGPAAPGDPGHGQRHAADGEFSQFEWRRGFDSERKAERRGRAGGALEGRMAEAFHWTVRIERGLFAFSLLLQSARHVPRRDAQPRCASSAPTWRAWKASSTRGAQKSGAEKGEALSREERKRREKKKRARNQSTCARSPSASPRLSLVSPSSGVGVALLSRRCRVFRVLFPNSLLLLSPFRPAGLLGP